MGSVNLYVVLLGLLSLCVGDTTVKYVHLAMTGDSSEMMVGWFTDDKTSSSTVKWGSRSGNYNFTASGSASEWKHDYGFNHFVKLTHLTPNARYYYVCGDGNGGWSSEFSFKAIPPAGSTNTFRMAIYGDMGIVNSQKTVERVQARLQRGEIDWVFHVGDISYADKHFLDFQKAWNTWFDRIQPIAASVPYMVCPGNHEYEAYHPLLLLATRNFIVYNARFRMPGSEDSSKKSMYYSFDYGPVHFVSLSTETSFKDAPFDDHSKYADQVSWLIEDLRVANLPENRRQRPWVMVMGHRPIYSSCDEYSSNGVPTSKSSLAIQRNFEDIFMKNKVDVIWNGHVHSYERNYPVYKNKRTSTSYYNPPTPFNIITGSAGSLEGLKNEHETKWDVPEPEWSAHRFGSDYGYGILTVTNGTNLDWKFYRVTDDGLEDSVVVNKV